MRVSQPGQISEQEQIIRRSDEMRLKSEGRKDANRRHYQNLEIYATQAVSTNTQTLHSFSAKWYAESYTVDGECVPEWYVRKVCGILRSIEKEEQLRQNTEADRTVIKSIIADRLQHLNWKTSEVLLDHCLQRYSELTDPEGEVFSAVVMDVLDKQIGFEPQPDDPENLILPRRKKEDTSEERFVRKRRIVHPIFDWRGHMKHEPREDEVMGDRYEPKTDREHIAQLHNALERFKSVRVPAELGPMDDIQSEGEDDDIDMMVSDGEPKEVGVSEEE